MSWKLLFKKLIFSNWAHTSHTCNFQVRLPCHAVGMDNARHPVPHDGAEGFFALPRKTSPEANSSEIPVVEPLAQKNRTKRIGLDIRVETYCRCLIRLPFRSSINGFTHLNDCMRHFNGLKKTITSLFSQWLRIARKAGLHVDFTILTELHVHDVIVVAYQAFSNRKLPMDENLANNWSMIHPFGVGWK